LQRMLELSIWADLRDGGERAFLVVAAAARLGFARVLVATTGPLAGDPDLTNRVLATAPVGLRVERGDPTPHTTSGPWPQGRIPSWPGRDLTIVVPAAVEGPISLDVPVAMGRTQAEAAARAASDPLFAVVGTPQQTGLFGRLEDVQARVAVLAVAGVTELCCILPAEDLLDHLAQLASAAVGRLDTLAPGLERSPDPPPPTGWGSPVMPLESDH
jgi:hypothetical protein